ncbi:MAG TPA: hypothetical protein VMT51_11225 [Dongiaceae bacterium]|nr:hypothetical protein [Dongiaceae bacterium]
MRIRRSLAVLLFVFFLGGLSVLAAAGTPWEKPPAQWSMADVFRILQESPWCAAKFSLESNYSQRHLDPQSQVVTADPNPQNPGPVPGVLLTPSHALPPVSVLWWSSRVVRIADAKRRYGVKQKSANEEPAALPDYVLMVEGDEPQRILRDAREDLHDTVFLELDSGGTLDLASVKFLEGAETDIIRTELHFSRTLGGQPAIDPESTRVVLHCRANAKKAMPSRENALAFRVEFNPSQMKVNGKSDF